VHVFPVEIALIDVSATVRGVKFIEEQLVSVLRDMPLETDCTLSVDALDLAGIRGTATQALWLNLRRPAVGNRGWRLSGAHWEYGATPVDLPPRGQLSYAMPPRLVSAPPASVVMPPIIVKPLAPLARRAPAKPAAAVDVVKQ
jgi:hypothetical protein